MPSTDTAQAIWNGPPAEQSSRSTEASDFGSLREFLGRHARLFVLTGAGVSTDSGIPDYRDADGEWRRPSRPVQFRDFMTDVATRRRYWARGLVGWQHLARAVPNDAHHALARLERAGRVELLVTQNVDRLHQAAGSEAVVDLHGRADVVRCMSCDRRTQRAELQAELVDLNPAWAVLGARSAPDGDADLASADYATFIVPDCAVCGGTLKPDVVFFGESVPRERVVRAMDALRDAHALLVVGSSLMVYSGYRFARAAAEAGKPIAAVNLGRTRADDALTIKVAADCATALAACVA
jgi:NAD-dependent SIR2 family protein deacetylase